MVRFSGRHYRDPVVSEPVVGPTEVVVRVDDAIEPSLWCELRIPLGELAGWLREATRLHGSKSPAADPDEVPVGGEKFKDGPDTVKFDAIELYELDDTPGSVIPTDGGEGG